MKIRNIINEKGNAVKNQFDIVEGYNHTFVSYETTIAEVHLASAFINISNDAFNYSMTTTRHFLNWLENVLCIKKPTRKDVEGWIKQGFIPMSMNCYSADIDIRIVDANTLNSEDVKSWYGIA